MQQQQRDRQKTTYLTHTAGAELAAAFVSFHTFSKFRGINTSPSVTFPNGLVLLLGECIISLSHPGSLPLQQKLLFSTLMIACAHEAPCATATEPGGR